MHGFSRAAIACLGAFAALACSHGSATSDDVHDEAADEDDDDGVSDPDESDGDDGGRDVQDPLEEMGDVDTVATGLSFAEGPLWIADQNVLLFTDIPNDAILQLDPSTDAVAPFIQGTGAYVNGLGLDALGNLLMCEGGNRRLTSRALNESPTDPAAVVADLWSGSPFNSPNDVATHDSGSIFFTDPTYGTDPAFGGSPPVLGFQGLYRIDPDGDLSLVDGGLVQPNGVVIAPDGDTLYVADTPTNDVLAYPLADDGSPGDGAVLFEVEGGGDGMTVDEDGNLYVASAAGVEVWQPDGAARWGIIPMPDVPTNCAFGGDDRRDLYVTLPTQLVRVRLAVPGLANAS
jgi:gluconolactonase